MLEPASTPWPPGARLRQSVDEKDTFRKDYVVLMFVDVDVVVVLALGVVIVSFLLGKAPFGHLRALGVVGIVIVKVLLGKIPFAHLRALVVVGVAIFMAQMREAPLGHLRALVEHRRQRQQHRRQRHSSRIDAVPMHIEFRGRIVAGVAVVLTSPVHIGEQ